MTAKAPLSDEIDRTIEHITRRLEALAELTAGLPKPRMSGHLRLVEDDEGRDDD
jgi:hypothetical protein